MMGEWLLVYYYWFLSEFLSKMEKFRLGEEARAFRFSSKSFENLSESNWEASKILDKSPLEKNIEKHSTALSQVFQKNAKSFFVKNLLNIYVTAVDLLKEG